MFLDICEARMEEIWKDVARYEGVYEVSNFGRVRSKQRIFVQRNGIIKCRKERILKTKIRDFYPEVSLCIDYAVEKRRVHDLVAEAFIGPRPEGLFVCHNDGSMDNNIVTNLRYDTQVGNMADTRRHGTYRCGEKINFARLVADDVIAIRRLKDSKSRKDIAVQFGIHVTTVGDILRGNRWKHLPLEPL